MKIVPEDLDKRGSHRLFLSILVPRPIAFISTVGKNGIFNAAPYSFFGGISSKPPLLAVSISQRRGEKKDTLTNIEHTGDFVVNIVTEQLAERMNIASGDYPPEVSEFNIARLTPAGSDIVRSPRILESPVNMECKLFDEIPVGSTENTLILGEVVLFHIEDSIYSDGEVDPLKLQPVGRLGVNRYIRICDIFEMVRPQIKR